MTDHRIEAVTLALHGGAGLPAGEDPAGGPTGARGDAVRARWREDAAIILAAADAADAAQGIHRVKLDDETVNLVALTLGQIQNRGDAFQVSHYLRAAHEVLEALTGAPSAHGRGAPGAGCLAARVDVVVRVPGSQDVGARAAGFVPGPTCGRM